MNLKLIFVSFRLFYINQSVIKRVIKVIVYNKLYNNKFQINLLIMNNNINTYQIKNKNNGIKKNLRILNYKQKKKYIIFNIIEK